MDGPQIHSGFGLHDVPMLPEVCSYDEKTHVSRELYDVMCRVREDERKKTWMGSWFND